MEKLRKAEKRNVIIKKLAEGLSPSELKVAESRLKEHERQVGERLVGSVRKFGRTVGHIRKKDRKSSSPAPSPTPGTQATQSPDNRSPRAPTNDVSLFEQFF